MVCKGSVVAFEPTRVRESWSASGVHCKLRRVKYYPALDGFRAIAIILVLLLHSSYGHLSGGFLGVDAFFVISGYLITRVLIEKHNLRFLEFYARRFQRLAPALGLALLLAAATWHFLPPPPRSFSFAALCAGLYATNIVAITRPLDLGSLLHTWSLATEEQFYVVWPACLWLLTRRPSQKPVRALLVAIVGIAFAKAVLHLLGSKLADYFSPLCRIDQLLIGCALALSPKPPSAVVSSLKPVAAIYLLALPVALLTVHNGMSSYYLGGMTLAALGAACVVAVAVDDSPSRVRSALSFPPLAAIGRLSYGLYLFHVPIFIALEPLRVPHSLVNFLWVTALRFGVSGLAAYLSYTFIEQPILRLGKTKETITEASAKHSSSVDTSAPGVGPDGF